MLSSALQCSAVLCSALQCSAVRLHRVCCLTNRVSYVCVCVRVRVCVCVWPGVGTRSTLCRATSRICQVWLDTFENEGGRACAREADGAPACYEALHSGCGDFSLQLVSIVGPARQASPR